METVINRESEKNRSNTDVMRKFRVDYLQTIKGGLVKREYIYSGSQEKAREHASDFFPEGAMYIEVLPVANEEKTVKELWEEFGEVLMDPETEEMEREWNGFPVGTHREEIWHWFEYNSNCSVFDLMYGVI